jgi:hypothetical protein
MGKEKIIVLTLAILAASALFLMTPQTHET